MKIQSHELSMQSEHTKTTTEIESQMSFATILQENPRVQAKNAEMEPINMDDFLAGARYRPEPTKDDYIDMDDFLSGAKIENGEAKLQEAQNSLALSTLNETTMPYDSIFSLYTQDTMKTIDAIIENLLGMIKATPEDLPDFNSMDTEPPSLGYQHFSLVEKYEESESLDFSTTGEIKTDTGSINIDVKFSMSRSFAIENRIDVYSSFDPLVINLDGLMPELSTDTFSFDLDNDGKKDQISQLKSGNGFLALDKNGDGIVNQGSELFGTLTGNGFGELSGYDSDTNDWIDENDSIFDSLRVWLKDETSDEKELFALGELGIGAIFLGSSASEFTYKTSMNQTLGELISSGVYLNENGTVGNISQIDFASRFTQEEIDIKVEDKLAKLLQA